MIEWCSQHCQRTGFLLREAILPEFCRSLRLRVSAGLLRLLPFSSPWHRICTVVIHLPHDMVLKLTAATSFQCYFKWTFKDENKLSSLFILSLFDEIYCIINFLLRNMDQAKKKLCFRISVSLSLKSYETADKTLQNKLKQLARQALDRWVVVTQVLIHGWQCTVLFKSDRFLWMCCRVHCNKRPSLTWDLEQVSLLPLGEFIDFYFPALNSRSNKSVKTHFI